MIDRGYHVWLAGTLASLVGNAVLFFALGWAASAAGGTAAALVLTAITLPRTVLMLLGGVAGDRLGARRVMIVCDALMVAVAAALGLVAFRWGTPLPVLVAAALVVGTVDAFYLPSSGSMPRRLVDDAHLYRAVALKQSGTQVVAMVGGPIGGAAVAFGGFAAAAWFDAATFAVVLVVLIAIRPRFDVPAAPNHESVAQAALDGVRVAIRTPALGPALLLVAGAAGFILPTTTLLVPLLARDHGWTAATAGLVVGAQGAGLILATFVVARRGSARRPGKAAGAGLLLAAAGQAGLAALGAPAPAVVAATLVGVGSGVFVANLAPLLLGAAPRTHLARIQALVGVGQSAALVVTNNVLGAVADIASVGVAVLCCAVALAACAGGGLVTPALRGLTLEVEATGKAT